MKKPRMRHRRLKLFFAALTLAASGCDPKPPTHRMPTHPVTGTLHVNGQPAVGAMVKFYDPHASGRMPTAVVQEDGGYAASYYSTEDGAPAGEYQILVLWMAQPPGGGLPIDRLGGRFADAGHSVRRVTVTEGENHLELINLKTSKPH